MTYTRKDDRKQTPSANPGVGDGRPNVPTERPDRVAAARDPGPGSENRPGFDLGGAKGGRDRTGSNVIPGGPKGGVSSGADATGRDTGLTDPSGGRSLGDAGEAGSDTGSGSTDGTGHAR